MYKLKERKGFTLAELLIVVAIIAVLVAIAIPVFTSQLEKSREATDLANVRSAYAEVVSGYLLDPGSATVSVKATQKTAKWQTAGSASTTTIGTNIGSEGQVTVPAKVSGTNYVITVSGSGKVQVN